MSYTEVMILCRQAIDFMKMHDTEVFGSEESDDVLMRIAAILKELKHQKLAFLLMAAAEIPQTHTKEDQEMWQLFLDSYICFTADEPEV